MNFLLNLFSGSYEELWKAIIRPFRDEYSDKDLGPEKFRLNSKYYKRTDFSLRNPRKQLLMCSYWEPYDEEREFTRLPCVIYLHGNSSSRCEVVPNLKYLLPLNITVLSFDFAACGRSEGEYISLGWYEILDVKCVINYLRNSHKVGPIGLWGRSMGAVTSIMYGSKDPSIAGLFLDSPFFSLNLLMDELSEEKVSLPGFLIKQVLIKVKETVKEKAGFNIDDIDTEKFCKKCFVPAFFCHGRDDTFVRVHHCKDLYKVYPGEKDILIVEGDHNDTRPYELNEKAAEFFYYALKCKYIKEINDYFLGYKLYIKEWFNPKYRTPSGSSGNNFKKINKDDINDINDINNILENKIFFETIPIKDEPENNYSKRRNISKIDENKINVNFKFNNKLKHKLSIDNKNSNNNIKTKKEQELQKKIYIREYTNAFNQKQNKIIKNMKSNYSNDNITNVNFNNYKKIIVNKGPLYPKDSFRNNRKNHNIIKVNKTKENLVLKTEINQNNNLRERMNREIIKINYQEKPMYNYSINGNGNSFYNKSSISVNKYRKSANNLIELNNSTNNRKRNNKTTMTSQPKLNVRFASTTIKTVGSNYNNSYFNLPTNIYYAQNKSNGDLGNNYYNITNNNIFINQFQNIYG